MKKIFLILLLGMCYVVLNGCNVNHPELTIENDILFYDGKEYILLSDESWNFNGFSQTTKVGWVLGNNYIKLGVYTFDEDEEMNFIRVEGFRESTPRIGVNKEYQMTSIMESHFNQMRIYTKSVWTDMKEIIDIGRIVDLQNEFLESSDFSNLKQLIVHANLYEYPFLTYSFYLYVFDESRAVLGFKTTQNLIAYYPVKDEFLDFFTRCVCIS